MPESGKKAGKYPVITQSDTEHIHQPFPVTEIQMAYIAGRNDRSELGGIGTHGVKVFDIDLDPARLNTAFNQLIQRHPMLRAVFNEDGTQTILKDPPTYTIEVEDLSALTPDAKTARRLEERTRMANHTFSPYQWPLFEFKILQLDPQTRHLYVNFDLLIADGASFKILEGEWLHYYHHPDQELPPLQINFRDYMLKYSEMRHSDYYHKSKAYWLDRLDSFPESPAPPYAKPPAAVTHPRFDRKHLTLTPDQVNALNDLCKKNRISLPTLLATAYAKTLAYWSNQEKTAVTFTVFNRYPFHEDVMKLVGDFTSILLIDFDFSGDADFIATCKKTHRTVLRALKNRFYEGVEFLRELSKFHDTGHKAIMPIVFTSMIYDVEEEETYMLGEELYGISRTPQVALDCQAAKRKDALTISWDYAVDLFDPQTITHIFNDYSRLLLAVLAGEEPGRLQPPAPHLDYIRHYNDSADPAITPVTLNAMVEAQITRTPDRIAVASPEGSITYAQLDRLSNQVAGWLVDQGIAPGDFVAVMGHRHIHSIVNILAVLKAGAAYVPIDPDYPDDRREYILSNNQCKLMLTIDHFDQHNMADYPHDFTSVPRGLDDISYTIYTSGSTGRPKGVVLRHGAAANTVIDINRRFGVNQNDRVLQISSLGFDLSVWDIFGALSAGAALILTTSPKDLTALAETLNRERITIWNSVPAIMDLMIETMGPDFRAHDLRLAMLSGDWIPLRLHPRAVVAFPNVELISLGGATEGAIWSIYYPIKEVRSGWKSIPYGYPLANQEFYVLNTRGDFCPVEVPGELHIGGVGVANGYMNDPVKTEAAFLHHPTLGYIYKTGDFGVWRQEGWIEFLGRRDAQVKIRGYRVELGEIETCILEHPNINGAAVVDKLDADNKKYLAAYLITDTDLSAADMRTYLVQKLPDYMIPSYFMNIDEIPITANGKVNKKALPEPWMETGHGEYAPPENQIQEKLVQLWQQVLGEERIGINDNFFDMGGDSLKIQQLINLTGVTFQVRVPIIELFQRQTVADLALFLQEKLDGAQDQAAPTDAALAIPSVRERNSDTLSLGQERLWFLEQLEPGTARYNVQAGVHMTGPLDHDVLARALSEVVARHEVMRTSFREVNGRPWPRIAEPGPVDLAVVDLADNPDPARLEQVWRETGLKPFDLEHGPMFQITLVRMAPQNHVMLITQHHVNTDGSSVGVIAFDLARIYAAFAEGKANPLAPLSLTYPDFSRWQRQRLQGPEFDQLSDWWRNRLKGLPALNLPHDLPAPPKRTPKGATIAFNLPAPLLTRIKEVARAEGATLYSALMAGFSALLSRYTGQTDFGLATVVAGRDHAALWELAGFFINTLVVRMDLDGDPTFAQLLRATQTNSNQTLEHQAMPFDQIVRVSGAGREGLNPLVQACLILENLDMPVMDVPDMTWTPVLKTPDASVPGFAKFDLAVICAEADGALTGVIEYSTDIFIEKSMVSLAERFITLLEGAVAEPTTPLSKLPVRTPEDEKVLRQWNQTQTEYPLHLSLVDLIEMQVDATPNAPAAVYENQTLTYAQLNQRANQLAHHLIEDHGIADGAFVGVSMDRSLELVVALLGILKAGGAYVPMDPAYPAERLRFMMEDSAVPLLITQSHLLNLLPESEAQQLILDRFDALDKHASKNPGKRTSPQQYAYMIYTSGSTGKPKGAINRHQGICNRLLGMRATFDMDGGERVLQKTPFSFDVSVWEFFLPLISGASCHLAKPGGHQDPDYLAALIQERRITTLHFVPSMLRAFMGVPDLTGCGSIRRIICSGEALPYDLMDRCLERLPGAQIHNLYGPTEAAIDVTHWPCRRNPEQRVAIGRPVPNASIHMLQGLEVMPPGMPGELCIGGVQVAAGYFNRDELTAEKFITADILGQETRIYRTGDLARLHPSGEIEYMGRIDNQVKLRGLRIELGEIEAVLSLHHGVREAAVLLHQETQSLIGYVTWETDGSVDALKEWLGDRLPDYMTPTWFIILDQMPLSPNGKLDRKALPKPDIARLTNSAERTFTAPRTATERRMAQLFSEILGVERVGVEDTFFDLGGHSLLAMTLVSRIRESFGVALPVRAVFDHPDVAGLALHVDHQVDAGENNASEPALTAGEPADTAEPSFAQQRMWFLDMIDPGNDGYNMPITLMLIGPLHIEALRAAFQEVINRHESLRTSFPEVDGAMKQRIHAPEHFHLPITDLTAMDVEGAEAEARRLAGRQAHHAFNLAAGPLLESHLYRIASDRHLVCVVMHHIISDGWSLNLMARELGELYHAFDRGHTPALEPLPIQYRDFARWQRQLLSGERLDRLSSWWRNYLAEIPDLELGSGNAEAGDNAGGAVQIHYPAELAEALTQYARTAGVTPFMLLTAVFQLLLSRYSGQTDFGIGTPVAARGRTQLEPLIGLFVNTLVLRADLSGNPNFNGLLERVRDAALGIFAHEDLPFERMVDQLGSRRNVERSPLFQVMFVLQNAESEDIVLDELTMRPVVVEPDTAKFDLTLSLAVNPQGIQGNLEYRAALFDREAVRRMIEHFRILLQAVLDHPQAPVHDLPVNTPEERRLLLETWNRTQRPQPAYHFLHQLFEARVDASPNRTALVYEGREMSYAQLEARANQLAHLLRAEGVSADQPVAVCMERSFDLVIALYAILKAGGAYLPLDPDYPAERRAFMLNDSDARLVLIHAETSAQFMDSDAHLIAVDDKALTTNQSTTRLTPKGDPDCAAYMIYTSGSTGRPRGVQVTHAGVTNYLFWRLDAFGLNQTDRVLQKTSVSFDSSIWEFFETLAVGATLVLPAAGAHRDPRALLGLIAQYGITATDFVPSLLRVALDEGEFQNRCRSLRRITTGGEALSPALLARFKAASDAQLYNGYGPTETTVASTFWTCEPGFDDVPIGRPVANTQLYILDPQMRPTPLGVPGELYIAGAGLARGYLARPMETAERFLPNPFSEKTGERLYRTGDRVRYDGEGNVYFLGRVDHQIKIRGFRVELSEIERVLEEHPAVKEAVVLAHDTTSGGKRLAGYILPCNTDTPPENDALLTFVKERLPAYMAPADWMILDTFPLTPSGKVDRKAFPKPERTKPTGHVAAGMERILADIWAEVLESATPGVNDNFFDLGGHSLLLPKLQRLMEERLGRKVEMMDLFRYPTINAMAGFLEDGAQTLAKPAAVVRRPLEQEPIAVIAASGRFPGANNVEDLWKNLTNGVESIRFFTREELMDAGISTDTLDNPNYVRAKAIIDQPEYFDAAFFGFGRREAEAMDPQQRIFLEVCYELFERAGHVPERIDGNVGVFAGSAFSPYIFTNLTANKRFFNLFGLYQLVLANSRDFTATRVAYKLNLKGPAFTVQTACSTSLVAVHQACSSLILGESDMAIAGGVSILPPFHEGYLYDPGGIASPDGHCRSFDANAKGTVYGQGAGAVLLRRLSDAQADGDPIIAVIRGSAVNNDGSDKIGFTAPSISGQARVIRDAVAAADVDPATIGYIEAHGTATNLGDPIEVSALAEVYPNAAAGGRRAIGSIKSNMGHLDSAAGVTGLIKAALTVRAGRIPPSLHFKTPNPELNLESGGFFVPTELTDWPHEDGPRRAAVSAFGLGGTNAHVILEQAPAAEPGDAGRPYQLMLLSARSAGALENLMLDMARAMRLTSDMDPADICYTLQVGRRHHDHRCALIMQNRDQAASVLLERNPEHLRHGNLSGKRPKIVFVFPGQGPDGVNMARGLYDWEPVFKRELDRCAQILKPLMNLDIRDCLYPKPGAPAPVITMAQEQPIMFSVEYAVAAMWAAYGIRPDAMIGHSLGEYVAACIAGVFTLEEGLGIITTRGALFQSLPAGAMIAVSLSEEAVQVYLNDNLSLAVINSPTDVVVSGTPEAVAELKAKLEADDVFCRMLHISRAAHSFMIEPVLDTFAGAFDGVNLQAPRIPFMSGTRGAWIEVGATTDVDYWVQHFRKAVRFADGVETLLEDDDNLFLEIGPGHGLTRLIRRHPKCDESRHVIATLARQEDEVTDPDVKSLLSAAGALWLAGCSVDWKAFHADRKRKRLCLPTYPFERKKYWVDAPTSNANMTNSLIGTLSEATMITTGQQDSLGMAFVAPRNEVEESVAELWCDILGVWEVSVYHDFFELGGDSIIALRMMRHLNEEFGIQLKPATLMANRTVAALARVIQGDTSGEGEMSPAVLLQQGDSPIPFWLCHAAGGGVQFYKEFAEAVPHIQIYGLASRGSINPENPCKTIEETAEYHVNAIRKIQPNGPYFLGGNSMGGAIAVEVARLLRADNEDVPIVVLMDTPGPEEMPVISPDQAHRVADLLGEWVNLDVAHMRTMPEREMLAYVFDRIAEVEDLPPEVEGLLSLVVEGRTGRDEAVTRLGEFLNQFRTNVEAFQRYKPHDYSGHLAYFRARERRENDPARPERAWIELAADTIEIAVVPGNHQTMMIDPHVETLARRVRTALLGAGYQL